jgi:hypothetical protein
MEYRPNSRQRTDKPESRSTDSKYDDAKIVLSTTASLNLVEPSPVQVRVFRKRPDQRHRFGSWHERSNDIGQSAPKFINGVKPFFSGNFGLGDGFLGSSKGSDIGFLGSGESGSEGFLLSLKSLAVPKVFCSESLIHIFLECVEIPLVRHVIRF